MDKLAALKVFCAVIEAGGFAPAADRLRDLSVPNIRLLINRLVPSRVHL